MKKLLSILLLSLISFISSAQSTEQYSPNNEIGITLFSINSNAELPFRNKYFRVFLNGVGYKRYFGNDVFRLGVELISKNERSGGSATSSSSYKESKFKIGYQKDFGNRKIKPSAAIDVVFIKASLLYEGSGGNWAAYYYTDFDYVGIGVAPSLSIKYQITNTLSLIFESSVDLMGVTKKGIERTNSIEYPDITTIPIHYTEGVTRFHPISLLSISVKF